ncbi:hypothetical protein [Lysobacter sp. A3-1-A15]|uniref:hypothetical protein n=1 Tax=Novilysobacter viscosus TaxID=3098602 RepID=UPI002EDB1399
MPTALTKGLVATAVSQDRPYELRDLAMKGLILRPSSPATKRGSSSGPVGSVVRSAAGHLTLDEAREREGAAAWLIDCADEIDPAWIAGRRRVGVTAGASAPDVLVRSMLERLQELGAASVSELHGEPEHMVFALPMELRLRLVG